MTNINLKISNTSKDIFKKNKEDKNIPYNAQIMSIFEFYRTIPVEDLASQIYIKRKLYTRLKTDTITVDGSLILSDLEYFQKIHNALLTKIPNLEFKDMILLMIDQYFNEI